MSLIALDISICSLYRFPYKAHCVEVPTNLMYGETGALQFTKNLRALGPVLMGLKFIQEVILLGHELT